MTKLLSPVLMLVTSPSNKLPWIVSQALEGGITIVQWRQKSGLGSGFNRAYAGITAVVQDAIPVLANIQWDSAEKLNVPNVHLPEKSVSVTAARKLVGSRGLIGKSVHSIESAAAAEAEGVDYLIAGTIFSSASHPDIAPQGLEFLKRVVRAAKIPVIAIGGISVEGVAECISAGAVGVAISSPLMTARDPFTVAKSYRVALESAWALNCVQTS